ncbi:MAG: ribonucleotide-diphosphate reductase subunit beta [Candidatus Ryanbacteria bacterium RIFCSPHIGHO2_02_FULL_45_43]|uniref:Ribonucleoside-diphosphate reductase subunit beta n=1 Tax=Candidatus Ryanbacteria bacterium RIFCSPHIGHO2_01_45_13 TaxID=1802112 RepID=A0A1G2G0D4_9BACT|nr:MAG: ribonucleotide-diphosphate reductase subunit beta [Candidatus Ryanbacteria bacterium RIFCSPHIGHO2_01_FULL_44_130]OGZ43557.1 MAG: ribonucleotide-diphosphate reductase subunit beta [Candidatus Ryanbacteria bacterium RIFCSPHIGHO2_01_45_13]OGZ47930.1 MAG: ribonucleotide-diphosphate reductase subunit beta [Candidatus Ryanbacteria bacterium RIFCSPHIGHO2_02_FULL_45_43]OGZ49932.1 MAG: ribonucleotide-diphosphate reductase subunit beta [Candidatus Ryanbacteria bacterium RIFCSPHIGHO2_12_FULL_44_20]
MPIKKTTEKVDINKRRIINGEDADVIQLYPMKHVFAWDAYNAANANHWLPTEIGMQKDVEQWKAKDVLSDDERHALKTVLGFFTTADSIAANNVVMAFYRHITSPECRLYLLRQAYEEAIHTHSYQYIVESLRLDESEIFNMYREVDSIYNKDAFVLSFNEGIFDPLFKTGTFENDQKFLENIIVFSLIMEGIFFYSSFAVMFGFQRQNKMVGAAEQIQYIMRDESMHLNFGIDLINTIKQEQPELWTKTFQERAIELVKKAAQLEYRFAQTAFPTGIFGMNAESFRQYIEHIADRRLTRIGLPPQFNSNNPFPWMSEAIDLSKEKNFFETRVTEYKTGGVLDWN